eukprot:gnl/TRDRNA2_/TRDRNA2_36788_c0_seq1.p1 gnl/TRDRNA2_/TRDRNA2_36788_c0~~gnl/TRDRNA2_/TRDRNA2_36788_c0_seq1.p1  ORF type:complete len:189 (-),score=34.22 gnl/TRDRNA2_/TRDRNA2_36788_c0_seq1:17-583(-)
MRRLLLPLGICCTSRRLPVSPLQALRSPRFFGAGMATGPREVAQPRGVGPFADGQDLSELFDILHAPPGGGKECVLDPSLVRCTGERKARSEVHRDGDWHRSIHVWVVVPGTAGADTQEVELLMQKRAQTKDTHPGLWDVSVAGHIDAGDEPLATAVREAEEELGLRVAPEQLEHIFTVAARVEGETG